MSTPTAIEIVRDCHAWRRGEGKYAGDGFIPPVNIMPPYWMCQESDALASVLRDAERFAALELAQDTSEIEVCWVDLMKDEPIGTLAELADKLRSETK